MQHAVVREPIPAVALARRAAEAEEQVAVLSHGHTPRHQEVKVGIAVGPVVRIHHRHLLRRHNRAHRPVMQEGRRAQVVGHAVEEGDKCWMLHSMRIPEEGAEDL